MSPTPKEVLVRGVGYVGALEAWDLRRRLMNGGIIRMLDFFPGKKEQALNVLGFFAGLGGMATIVLAYLNGGEGAEFKWEAFGAAYAAAHYSLQQFLRRIGDARTARELKAKTEETAEELKTTTATTAAEIKATTIAATSVSQQVGAENRAPMTVPELTTAVEANMTPVPKAKEG